MQEPITWSFHICYKVESTLSRFSLLLELQFPGEKLCFHGRPSTFWTTEAWKLFQLHSCLGTKNNVTYLPKANSFSSWSSAKVFSSSPILACITGALWATRGERSILREARNEWEAFSSPRLALRTRFAPRAKSRVRLAWLIKRLLCRLLLF